MEIIRERQNKTPLLTKEGSYSFAAAYNWNRTGKSIFCFIGLPW